MYPVLNVCVFSLPLSVPSRPEIYVEVLLASSRWCSQVPETPRFTSLIILIVLCITRTYIYSTKVERSFLQFLFLQKLGFFVLVLLHTSIEMAKDGPNWDGLLKWSLAHSDGTGSSRNLRYPSRMLLVYIQLVYTYYYTRIMCIYADGSMCIVMPVICKIFFCKFVVN